MAEVEAVEDGQAGLGPVELGDGDGPVELDDGRAGLGREGVVERGDLAPVARLLQVQVGDGGLHGVGAGLAARDGPLQEPPAFADLLLVPQRAVLVVEQDDLAVAGAGGSAGVVQQHEREQREDLALVGHELGQGPAELDRLGAEVDAASRPSPG